MSEQDETNEAGRYTAEQRKLILAFARHGANPYQLLDHWLHGEPVRTGFASFRRPDLDVKAWDQLAELHRYSKSEVTQRSNYAASLASLLLFESLFPQDFGQGRFNTRLAQMIVEWEPKKKAAAEAVAEWCKNTHPVYSAWFAMRVTPCCALSIMSVAHLANHGFHGSAAGIRASRKSRR